MGRVRVITQEPLPPLKIWIGYPENSTFSYIAEACAELVDAEIELELEGFSLMLDSPCSMLTPSDIIHIKLGDGPPPIKRIRMTPSPSAPPPPLNVAIVPTKIVESSSDDSSDSSSDDEAPAPISSKKPALIPSKPAVESSSDSSSSDSSDSSDDEELPLSSTPRNAIASTSKLPLAPMPILVIPGEGLSRTQNRNLRNRIRKEALLRLGNLSNLSLASPSASNPATPALSTRIDPYADFAEPISNKNQQSSSTSSTALHQLPATSTQFFSGPQPSKTIAPSAIDSFISCPVSPKFSPPSPELTYGDISIGSISTTSISTPRSAKTKKQKQFERNQAFFLPAPSARKNLPPSILVTKVDVESPLWVAGVGTIVEGTSTDWIQVEVEASLPVVPVATVVGGGYWAGWPSIDEVERRFEGLTKALMGETKQGDLVAVKVLELNQTTFAPSLNLKFGSLLPLRGSTNALRIRLHPACYANAEEVREKEWIEGFVKERKKFGQDAMEENELIEYDVYEGEWNDVRRC